MSKCLFLRGKYAIKWLSFGSKFGKISVYVQTLAGNLPCHSNIKSNIESDTLVSLISHTFVGSFLRSHSVKRFSIRFQQR